MSAAVAVLLCLGGAWVADSTPAPAAGLFILATLALVVPASLDRVPALRAWGLLGWSIAATGEVITFAGWVGSWSEPTWPLALTLPCLAVLAVAALAQRPWRVGNPPLPTADQHG